MIEIPRVLVERNFSTILQGVSRALLPPPRYTVSQWADQYRMLSPEASAEPGRWKTDRTPYMRGVMDTLNDPSVQTIVVMSSAQVGKTELLLNIIGFYCHFDPAPILFLNPTLEMSETFSKDRLAPMIRDTPVLKTLFADPKTRNAGNTLLYKKFFGGQITMAGANSPASLASRPIRVVLADEVDRYPASAGAEGDPLHLAFKRTTTFFNKKRVVTSTPTVKDASRIEAAFLESDQRRYFMPCVHCGEWDYFRWTDPEHGYLVRWPEGRPDLAAYYCPHCGGEITDADKLKMLRKGEWRATAKGRDGVAGFHLNELCSPWRKFGDTAADFLEAKRSPETLKTWVNTALGETWEEDYSKKVDHEGLAKRAEDYSLLTVPEQGLVITAGIDVQDNRVEIIQRAWGEGEESWLVNYQVIAGDPAKEELWEQVLDVVNTPFEHASGAKLVTYSAAIDTGGHFTHEVYAFTRAWGKRHIIGVKGMSQAGKAALGKPTKQDVNIRGSTIKNGAKLWPIGSDTIKNLIYGRLNGNIEGPGAYHWPKGLPEDYWKQLVAEKQITKILNGFPKRVWVKKPWERNEALDCEVYAYAALEYLYTRHNRNSFWSQMKARLTKALHEDVVPRPLRFSSPELPPARSHTPETVSESQAREAIHTRPSVFANSGRVSLTGWRRG